MNCSSILEDDIISIMCVAFDCQNLFPGLFCKLHIIIIDWILVRPTKF